MRMLYLLPITPSKQNKSSFLSPFHSPMEMMNDTKIKLAPANQKEPPLSSSPQIDQRLQESFRLSLPVTSHSTYTSMVFKAITELGEEGGSSEDSILEYIKANYDDLSWAHDNIHRNHLNRLCDEGIIVLLSSKRYSIPGFTWKCEQGSSSEKLEPALIRYTYRRLRHGQKRKSFFQVLLGLYSCDEEHHHQDARESELSIAEIVKTRRRQTERKCVYEEESSENDSSYERLVKKKEVSDNRTDRVIVFALAVKSHNLIEQEKRRVISDNECMYTVASFERLVKKQKKENSDHQTDGVIVFALGAKSPNSLETKRGRRLIGVFQPEASSVLSNQETKSKQLSWIESLIQTDFHGQCKVHENVEKSVCNLYCTDCKNEALCSFCVTSHEGHHIVRIDQTDCEAAVDVSVIEKHIDISGIQTLKTSATNTTIVLKRTIPSWFSKPANNVCLFCKRRVPFPFKFCALSCKIQHEHKVG